MSRPSPSPAEWQQALGGDRDAFEAAVAPFQDELMRTARRLVALEQRDGRLREDALAPEELVGETLVRAFDHRERFDAGRMSFRAWLIGLQHRTLAHLAAAEHRYNDRKAISLDEEVPTNERQDAVEEAMYEFREPFDVLTYEEVIPGSIPADVEVPLRDGTPLSDEEWALLDQADLDPTARRVAVFHDEFELNFEEVAQIMNVQLNDVAESYNLARTTLRERIGSTRDFGEDDPKTDSYTGDPL